MNIGKIIGDIGGGIVKPVTDIFGKREDRRRIVETIRAKTAQGRQQGETEVTLNESEWELIGQQMQAESWKDEFVTLIVFAPFITTLAGAILAAFGRPELANAAADMMAAIAAMDVEYGRLMWITAMAALGLRAMKR